MQSVHQPPRHPHAWLPLFLASQLLVAAIWWTAGWPWGVASMLATHGAMVWGSLHPRSRLFSPVLSRLPTDAREVWLTIDDGPSAETEAMLDALDAHGAKATFFLVGARAQARPDLVQAIAQRGHGIGNHSDTHPSAWFWALGPRRMRREIDATQATLASITGQPPRWFRGVVGMANPFVATALHAHGLARVAWSARGFDAVSASPAVVVARIERTLKPGAIVLMHEGAAHGRNVETMRLLLARLDALGYRCVEPSEPEITRVS